MLKNSVVENDVIIDFMFMWYPSIKSKREKWMKKEVNLKILAVDFLFLAENFKNRALEIKNRVASFFFI